MQLTYLRTTGLALFLFSLVACNNEAETGDADSDTARVITEKEIAYSSDGVNMKGLIVYNANQKTKGPAILVVHEWWGLNDYTKSRARQLA